MSILNFVKFEDQNIITKFLISLLISVILIKLLKRIYEIFRLPPGPYGLPIVGYLPFMSENFAGTYIEMGKKYGSPFSIHLGKYDFIVINDWDHTHEALGKEELLARPPEGIAGGLLGEKGVGDLSGQPWKDQRRTALHILRDIGFGKSAMEDKISEEIEIFVKELDKQKGKPYNILGLLSASTSNNICIMTYGKRFEYDDEEKIQQDIQTKRGAEGSTVIGIATAMPYMVKLLKFLGNKKYKLFMEAAEDSYAFESAQIEKHQNPDYDHIFDYIDGFLEKMDERKAKGLPLGTFTLPVLRANIGALFGAGSITVFASMSWVILFLVKHPQYQSRIREEISRVIGSRRPSFEDRLLMPFTVAFIYETLRYRTIIPVNLTRYAAKDVYLNQTFIPRGTSVVINFYSIDHDPNLWTEPDKFMPEQLLSTDQSKLNIPSYLTPWGVGKRKCIGETLAFVEIFQYLTCFVQRYELSAQGGPNKVSDEIKHGFVSLPLDMPLIVLQSAN